MSLRTRITLLVALAVTVAVTAVAWVAYAQARSELRAEIDDFLRERGPFAVVGAIVDTERGDFGRSPFGFGQGGGPEQPPGQGRGPTTRDDVEVQFVLADGQAVSLFQEESVALPVDDEDLEVATGKRRDHLRNVTVAGTHYRMLTLPFGEDAAIQMARDLTETNDILSDLRLRLFGLGLGGVAVAAALGWLVSRRAVAPVERITTAAEHVAATKQLDAAIDVDRNDELGRLAASFNEMLAGLQESRDQQTRLVTDASHELRTPLTSLRTNLELLAARADIPETERAEMLQDLTGEVSELSDLVAELVDLATIGAREEAVAPVNLSELVERVADRTERRSGRQITVDLEPTTLEGRSNALQRAVSNLLENAAKWSPADGTITVTLQNRRLAVRDHGPGFADEDLPHVFERFYRSASARSMPGSGLGLAIVASVAEAHDATAFAENHPDGGAVVGIDFAAT